MNVTALIIMDPDLIEDDIGGLLGLRARITRGAPTWVAWIIHHEIRRAQHPIIPRKVHHKIDAVDPARTRRHL